MIFEAVRVLAVKLLVMGSIVMPVGMSITYTQEPIPQAGPSAKYLMQEMKEMEYRFWGVPKEK